MAARSSLEASEDTSRLSFAVAMDMHGFDRGRPADALGHPAVRVRASGEEVVPFA
jgi:hypothetical protein